MPAVGRICLQVFCASSSTNDTNCTLGSSRASIAASEPVDVLMTSPCPPKSEKKSWRKTILRTKRTSSPPSPNRPPPIPKPDEPRPPILKPPDPLRSSRLGLRPPGVQRTGGLPIGELVKVCVEYGLIRRYFSGMQPHVLPKMIC